MRVDHNCLPSPALNARTYSLANPSLLSRYMRSPTTDGVEKPYPTLVTRHTSFGPPAGHCCSRPVSVERPVRCGPRHCGQLAAAPTSEQLVTVIAARNVHCLFIDCLEWGAKAIERIRCFAKNPCACLRGRFWLKATAPD